MRDFLKKVLLPVVGVVMVGICVLEPLIRNKDTFEPYRVKSAFMKNNANKLRLLVIGPSTAACGIKPEYICENGYNLGFTGQSPRYDKFLFDKYFDKMDSLKYVIMSVGFDGPYNDGIYPGRTAESYTYIYSVFFDCPYFRDNFLSRKLLILGGLNAMKTNYKKVLIDENDGYLVFHTHLNKDNWEQMGTNSAIHHNKIGDDSIFVTNMRFIENIAEKCNSRNVKFILISAPIHHFYSDNMSEEKWQKIKSALSAIATKYENVKYCDYLKSPLFTDIEFRDPNHLNYNGAYKLTHMLNDSIRKWEGR